jgi:hypothetical protein
MKFQVAIAGLDESMLLIEAETPWDAVQEYACQNRLPAKGWLVAEGDHVGSFQIIKGVLQQTEFVGRHEPDSNDEVIQKQNQKSDNTPIAVELTPEEKQKIYAEEKARLEAQQQIRTESERQKTEADDKSVKQGCLGLFVFIAVIAIFGNIFDWFSSDNNDKESDKPSYIALDASVRYNGDAFIITNNDSFSWHNIEFTIRSSYNLFSEGYVLRKSVMNPGDVFRVDAMQFTKQDGTRFNPYQFKVKDLIIRVSTNSLLKNTPSAAPTESVSQIPAS